MCALLYLAYNTHANILFAVCKLTCKSLHLPWQNQLLCSYLAHRLPTTIPVLCHQILTLSTTYATNTAYHTPAWPYFPTPAGKIAQTLAALPSDIWFFTTVLSSKSTLPCQHQLLCQLSTSEAKCMAACSASTATAHICMLLYNMTYLGTKQWRESMQCLSTIPSILMINNKATVQIARKSKLTWKTRHIEWRSTMSVKDNKKVHVNYTGYLVNHNLQTSSQKHKSPPRLTFTLTKSFVLSLTTC